MVKRDALGENIPLLRARLAIEARLGWEEFSFWGVGVVYFVIIEWLVFADASVASNIAAWRVVSMGVLNLFNSEAGCFQVATTWSLYDCIFVDDGDRISLSFGLILLADFKYVLDKGETSGATFSFWIFRLALGDIIDFLLLLSSLSLFAKQ